MARIRVLIVDDSLTIRSLLSRIFSSDSEIEVIGTASDAYMAREKLVALKPDVMTLDIDMPKMDGITFLEKVMIHFPIRTLIISNLSKKNSEIALRALEVGAVDVMLKPVIDGPNSITQMSTEICNRVKAVAQSNLNSLTHVETESLREAPSATHSKLSTSIKSPAQILAIASSTGGTEALKVVLKGLPKEIPGTLIVQHMLSRFTEVYSQSLSKLCPFEVKVAAHGDRVMPGRVLIAPGDFHMEITKTGSFYEVVLHQQPPIHGLRPAADYLMRSVAKYAGRNCIGVILTGMGRDGANGMLAMKEAGGFTIAQSKETCVVFGMPREAIQIGAVNEVVPLAGIAEVIMNRLRNR